jgi:hypothetical protein
VRNIQVRQPQAGWGLGTVDMGKTSELPINVVKVNKLKRLTSLNQKGIRIRYGASNSPYATVDPAVNRQTLNPFEVK